MAQDHNPAVSMSPVLPKHKLHDPLAPTKAKIPSLSSTIVAQTVSTVVPVVQVDRTPLSPGRVKPYALPEDIFALLEPEFPSAVGSLSFERGYYSTRRAII